MEQRSRAKPKSEKAWGMYLELSEARLLRDGEGEEEG